MRIFAISQGKGLDLVDQTLKALLKLNPVESISHYVADSTYYAKYIKTNGPVELNGTVIKEWEEVSKGLTSKPTAEEITTWEKRLKIPSLWPAIIAERRVFYGKNCRFKQDYKPRHTLEEMQGIVTAVIKALWNAFEEYKPDVVLSFNQSIMGAFIAYLIAQAKGIPCLTFNSTKIENYVSLSPDLTQRYANIRSEYTKFYANKNDDDPHVVKAQHYLERTQNKRIVYEGSLKPKKDTTLFKALAFFIRKTPAALVKKIRDYCTKIDFDPQRVNHISSVWHLSVGGVLRRQRAKPIIKGTILSLQELSDLRYVFFPLCSEPEIALGVYSPYCLNQIEVVRNIAQSVPLGTLIVIKEHPRSWGYRSPDYYKKLIEIPNVRLVSVDTPTNSIIQKAQATMVISSFVGFEAVLQGVPVFTFGNCIFDMLPSSMVRRIHAMENLPQAYKEVMENYRKDEHAIKSFVAAVMKESIPIDLYTAMLRKNERETLSSKEEASSLEKQYENLAHYFRRRYQYEIQKH